MGPSLFEQIKNFVEFNIYKNFTSPDANRFVEEKKEEEKKAEIAAQPAPSTVEPLNIPLDRLGRIWSNVYEWAANNLPIVFGFIFAILISNEMIVHPAKVRIVFFIFTMVVCISSAQALYTILVYYLIKLGYYFYKDEKEGIMPYLFAVCPIWVAFPVESGWWNPIKRFLTYPFTYIPRDKPEKEEKLNGKEGIMARYKTQLKDLKPWTKYDEYRKNEQNAMFFLDTLHKRTPGTEEKTEAVSTTVASLVNQLQPEIPVVLIPNKNSA